MRARRGELGAALLRDWALKALGVRQEQPWAARCVHRFTGVMAKSKRGCARAGALSLAGAWA